MRTFAIRMFNTVPAILHHHHRFHTGLRYPTASILQMVTNPNAWDLQSYHHTDSAHPLTHAPTPTFSSISLESSSIMRTICTHGEYLHSNSHVVLASSTTLHTIFPSLQINTVSTRTSICLFNQAFDRLVLIRDMNCKILGPCQYAAPAATIQSFVNGAVESRLPSREQWVEAYKKDKECATLLTLVKNPGKIGKDSLKDVPYCFRQPLQNSHIIMEDEMLIYREPIWGSTSYFCLQIILVDLQNILFIAFHTTQSVGTSTLTRLCTTFAFTTFGRRCSPTFNECAALALTAPLPTRQTSCRS